MVLGWSCFLCVGYIVFPTVLVSFLMIVSWLVVSLLFVFTHIFVFIRIVMIAKDVRIILVDRENISFEASLLT
jgi:hypothetical protein